MSTKSTPVGFIGLGRMGRGMALNLATAVETLYVFDSAPEPVEALTDNGAHACADVVDVTRNCDLIFLCLPSAKESRQVIFGPGGIASAPRPGLTIVDCTTLDRTDALTLAEEAAAVSIAYWDCPVSGMPFRADDGTLTVMFGGTSEAFESVKPYLSTFSDDVIHSGAIGAGQAMKAINNIIYNINIAALCEVLPLAVAVGLEPEKLASLTTTASSRSFASEYFVPRMMERRFDTDFALEDAYKDIINVQTMGAETGAQLPVVNAMIATYEAAMTAGYAREPKSAMLKVYEQALGVEFSRAGRKNEELT